MLEPLIQLAETDINIAGMLALFLVIAAFGFVTWQWKRPPIKPEANENDTIKVIAEAFGGIIANELKKVVQEMKIGDTATTQGLSALAEALNNLGANQERLGATQERIAELITTHNNKSKANRVIIDETKETVTTMNTDIEVIKTTLARIDKQIAKGVPMDIESMAVMQKFIDCANQLEDTLKKATQETPQVEVSKPKPQGVPVTLKPTDVIKPDSGQEKTE